MAVPLLIALPKGLAVSGITLWAVRLVNARAGQGRPAGLLVHREPAGHTRLDTGLHPEVERFDLSDLPDLAEARGDLAPWIARYREAARRLADRHGRPVVVSPNLLGDCYGAAAALCVTEPDAVRLVGWHHSPIDYNDRVLARYEPVIARFVAVSDRIERRLRESLPQRAGDVVNVPYGIPVPEALPPRAPLAGRGVRLIYTGRLDHKEKRIMVLSRLARVLGGRGVGHVLTVVGDGPARDEFARAVRDLPSVRLLPPAPPAEIARLLEASDALVLASRYEGLSISMLEAMAAGCVPIVTRVDSGVGQAIEAGVNGELCDADPEAAEADVAEALADAVERFVSRDTRAMAGAAWRTARESFSIERHVEAVEAILEAVACVPGRAWPADRPCAFTAVDAAGGSGSVPPDGARRLASMLEKLGGRRVVIHGTGEHTRQLARVLASSPSRIVAFADADRDRCGGRLWDRPIVSPEDAGSTGATDVVISSWINQAAIWSHRDVYESQGLAVHRLYD